MISLNSCIGISNTLATDIAAVLIIKMLSACEKSSWLQSKEIVLHDLRQQ